MHIESLKYFQQIAEIKSISKVANKSHISQPALSQQIQKLEDSLGKQLFVRSNRGVKLTPAGETVLKYADNIIRTYEKMLSDLEDQEKEEIKVEAEFSIATYCLPCALLNMKNKFPTINFNLTSDTSDKIEQDVLSDICEVGFITRPPEEKELTSENVVNEKVVLISPNSYDLPEKIKLEDVLDKKFVVLKEECIIKDNFKKALNKMGSSIDDIEIIAELETTEAMKTLVRKGFGIAFVPYNSVRDEFFTKELNISKITDYSLDYDIYMINKKHEYLSENVKDFINRFIKLGNNICY